MNRDTAPDQHSSRHRRFFVGGTLAGLLGIDTTASSAIWSRHRRCRHHPVVVRPIAADACQGSLSTMVTVLDTASTLRGRAIRKRRTGRTRRYCASRTGSASGRRSRRGYAETREIVRSHSLVTVCEEAGCPNIGECWDKKHATFMIMGEICTRACAFCNVATGMPERARPGRAGSVSRRRSQDGADPCRHHLGRPRRSR